MKGYECLEFQWVEPKHNQNAPAPEGYVPYDKPSVQFNDFSEKNHLKFHVYQMTAVSGTNKEGQSFETLYVMILWN